MYKEMEGDLIELALKGKFVKRTTIDEIRERLNK